MDDNQLKAFRWGTVILLLVIVALFTSINTCQGNAAMERDVCQQELKMCRGLCR